jgi:hypothetical protein
MKTKVIHAGVRRDRVPVAQNEDGPVFGDEFVVVAESATGRRWVHKQDFDTAEGAERLAARVEKARVIDLTHWVETYPVYGSSAWEVEDGERHLNLLHAIHSGDREGIERYS